MRAHSTPALPLALAAVLLGGCGKEDSPAAAPAPVAATAPAGPDWARCRFPGLALPVNGRLFVVDAAAPDPDAEPGRETIRRVDVVVPGPVLLFLTAREATAWHVRPAPQTEVRAVIALGDQPQRITGQRLGDARLERSRAMGDDCGRYWLAGGAGPELATAVEEIFGRPHDAIYTLRSGSVIIGDANQPPSEGP